MTIQSESRGNKQVKNANKKDGIPSLNGLAKPVSDMIRSMTRKMDNTAGEVSNRELLIILQENVEGLFKRAPFQPINWGEI